MEKRRRMIESIFHLRCIRQAADEAETQLRLLVSVPSRRVLPTGSLTVSA